MMWIDARLFCNLKSRRTQWDTSSPHLVQMIVQEKKCAKWNHNKISDADWLSSRLPFQESDLDTTIPHLVWLIWRQLTSIYVRTYCNTIIINELNLFINFFDTFDFERGKICMCISSLDIKRFLCIEVIYCNIANAIYTFWMIGFLLVILFCLPTKSKNTMKFLLKNGKFWGYLLWIHSFWCVYLQCKNNGSFSKPKSSQE